MTATRTAARLFPWVPGGVAIVYAFVSAAWIFFSDELLLRFAGDVERYRTLQTYKGTFFICGSALLIFLMLSWAWRRIQSALARVTESEERLQLALSGARGGSWEIRSGPDGWFVAFVSTDFLARFGLPADFSPSVKELVARTHADDADRVRAEFDDVFSGRNSEPYESTYRVRAEDGAFRWIHSRGSALRGKSGAVERLVGVSLDVTEQMRAEERLNQLLRYDALTGLTRPGKFISDCDRQLAGVAPDLQVGLIQLRPSGLDPLIGEAETEEDAEVMQRIADRLKEEDGADFLMCRVNGNTFALATPPLPSLHHIQDCLNSLLDRLVAPLCVRDRDQRLDYVIGVAVYPQDGQNAHTLLRNSGHALDAVAQAGDTRIQWFTQGLDAAYRRRSELMRQVRRAVETGSILCHFQPLVDFVTGRTAGFEALVRWKLEDGTILSPAEFIPLAEQTGYIRDIGEDILKQACCAAAGWQGVADPAPFVAVNVSPVQLSDPAFAATVARVLTDTALKPSLLELEVTEGVLTSDPKAVAQRLTELRRLGVSIAIDDFGTGYSSLSLLGRLPFTRLKIDRSFVAVCDEEAGGTAIVDTILELSRRLGLATTAEGVETALQAERLAARGVDLAQGYYFSRPVPRSVADRLVHQQWSEFLPGGSSRNGTD